MSIAKHMRQLMDIDLDSPSTQAATTTAPAKAAAKPTTAPSQLASFSTEFNRLSEEADSLRKTRGEPVEIDLDLLDASPHQTRKLDNNRVEELVANLASNPLATPITVRLKPNGRYELVAGHHRVEAFRVLGRKTIKATIIHVSEDEAERLVFYDNLLAPNLSDYERYLGFRSRKLKHKLSDNALADEAGISRSLVQALMSYSRLPEGVLEILHEHRGLIGSTLAVKMAALETRYTARMIEATHMLREGSLTQARVLQWIEQKERPQTAAEPAPAVFRKGRQTYAKVARSDKKLVITWSDTGEAEELEAAIAEVLRARIELLRRAELPEQGEGGPAAGTAASTK